MARLKKTILAACLAIIAAGLLTACSGGEAFNPDHVEVTLTTDPAPAAAGAPAELQLQMTGVPEDMRTFVTFEVRLGEVPDLLDADNQGNGLFTGTYSFPEAGSYDVYLHLYIEDYHLIKKQQVEVQ